MLTLKTGLSLPFMDKEFSAMKEDRDIEVLNAKKKNKNPTKQQWLLQQIKE